MIGADRLNTFPPRSSTKWLWVATEGKGDGERGAEPVRKKHGHIPPRVDHVLQCDCPEVSRSLQELLRYGQEMLCTSGPLFVTSRGSRSSGHREREPSRDSRAVQSRTDLPKTNNLVMLLRYACRSRCLLRQQVQDFIFTRVSWQPINDISFDLSLAADSRFSMVSLSSVCSTTANTPRMLGKCLPGHIVTLTNSFCDPPLSKCSTIDRHTCPCAGSSGVLGSPSYAKHSTHLMTHRCAMATKQDDRRRPMTRDIRS